MSLRAGCHRVAAAFARERDAQYAVRLGAGAIDAPVAYRFHPVVSETGYVQLVVLEATFDEPSLAARLLDLMRGAHGVPIPAESLDGQLAI